MRPLLTLIASALLASSIAIAQEQQTPSGAAMPEQGQMGQGMMGCPGMAGHGMKHKRMMGHGVGLRLLFILMDTDGDGAVSLEEFQSAHARIFKQVDANKDGKITLEEIHAFFHGGPSTSDQ
jgi:hypothetical protein